jgi:hypothetical protein
MSAWLRIAVAAALAVSLAGVTAGCGATSLADVNEGQLFEMHDVRMNVLYDRFLNPGDIEDAAYLAGQGPPPEGKSYFAVFLRLENQGSEDLPLPSQSGFEISDTTGAKYQPLASGSPFAMPFGQSLAPDDVVPVPDSIAAAGPTHGSMVLFLLDQGVTENRPLELQISYLGERAQVKLDL